MSGHSRSGDAWDATASDPAGSFPPGDVSAAGGDGGAGASIGAAGASTGAAGSSTGAATPGALGAPPGGGPPRYTREGLLGRGGMGVVYLARDHHLDRLVALKEAARGGQVAARLAQEARVTAGLDHPGIVTVHDSGHTEDGRPFYTMRLLRGRPLATVLAERTTWPERTPLVRHYLDACHAVASAHAEGVVHRDLKPANLMVGGFGETQVVDWGLATRVGEGEPGAPRDAAAAGDGRATQTGAVLGTPAYMAPEQARGEPTDPRADVWSLGAVLFELLTGEPVRAAGGPAEVLAAARAGTVPSLRGRPELPPELVTIAERALAVAPADRYPDAGALAADVEAFVDGRRVAAHAYTSWELLSRLVRRWRAPLTVAAAAVLLVVALVTLGTVRLARERDRVVAAERETRAALVTSDESLARALSAQALTLRSEGSNAAAALLATRAVHLGDVPEAWGLLAGLAMEPRAERLEEHPVPDCVRVVPLDTDDLLCVSDAAVARVTDGKEQWRWTGRVAALREDGVAVWVGEPEHGAVTRIDLASGAATAGSLGSAMGGGGPPQDLWPLERATWGVPAAATPPLWVMEQLCPGTGLLAAATRRADSVYGVLCTDGRFGFAPVGRIVSTYVPTSATREALSGAAAAVWTPDGRWFVAGGTKGAVAAIDPQTGAATVAATLPGGAWRLAGSVDGAFVAISGDRGDVDVRTLPALTPLVRVPATAVRGVRFRPDGTLLVVGAETTSRWRLPTAPRSATLHGADGVTSAIWSPDGALLATAHGQQDAIVWDAAVGAPVARLDIGKATAKAAVFTPDSRAAWFALVGPASGWRPQWVATDGRRGELSEALARSAYPIGQGTASLRRVVMARTGVLLGLPYTVGDLLAYDTVTGRGWALTGCPAVAWSDAGQSPDGGRLVLVGGDDRVQVVEPGPPLRCGATWRVPGAGSADVDAAGGLVVSTTDTVIRLDAAGNERWRATAPAEIKDVAVSADGRWIAVGGTDHHARLWDDTGRLRAVFEGHGERVASVDFRPDNAVLATGSWDGTARLWDLRVLGQDVAALDAAAPDVWGLSFADALAATGE